MKTSGNTILITGGGSGIGLETAKLFAKSGNTVVITGRSEEKLKTAAKNTDNLFYIACDVTNEKQVDDLVKKLENDFGTLNILMNNAGVAKLHNVGNNETSFKAAENEMKTNYLSVVNLTSKLLPLLKQQAEAAIINVSSIVAFSPSVNLPTYSASKAALHAYTQVLRLSLTKDRIKVFEIMPPLVDTPLTKEIPTEGKISPKEVAEAIRAGVDADIFEIHVAQTETFFQKFFNQSEIALHTMNKITQ